MERLASLPRNGHEDPDCSTDSDCCRWEDKERMGRFGGRWGLLLGHRLGMGVGIQTSVEVEWFGMRKKWELGEKWGMQTGKGVGGECEDGEELEGGAGVGMGWISLGVGTEMMLMIKTELASAKGCTWCLQTSFLTLMLPPTVGAEQKDKVLHGGPCEQLSHPYQAALYTSGHLLCGGVLIHPLWVLTAAHCKKP